MAIETVICKEVIALQNEGHTGVALYRLHIIIGSEILNSFQFIIIFDVNDYSHHGSLDFLYLVGNLVGFVKVSDAKNNFLHFLPNFEM
jgi:hypothetical protein